MKFDSRPKRDPIKNCFLLPNELFALGLSTGEIAVYSYLLRCENRESHQCWPSYQTIGSAVGLSKKTVQKYVTMLEDKRLITTEPTTIRTKDGRSRNGNLLYTIRPIQEAVNHFHEQQMRQLELAAAQRRAEKKRPSWASTTHPQTKDGAPNATRLPLWAAVCAHRDERRGLTHPRPERPVERLWPKPAQRLAGAQIASRRTKRKAAG